MMATTAAIRRTHELVGRPATRRALGGIGDRDRLRGGRCHRDALDRARSAASGNAIGSGAPAAEATAATSIAASSSAAVAASVAAARRRRHDRPRPGPGLEIGRGGGHDPRLEPGRRFDRRHALGEGRQHAAQLGDLGMRVGAGLEMGADGRLLGGVERTQDERPGHLPDLVAGQGTHPVGSGHAEPASRARRMASRPRRIRLLTVPSGVPVRSAISCWVNPPK